MFLIPEIQFIVYRIRFISKLEIKNSHYLALGEKEKKIFLEMTELWHIELTDNVSNVTIFVVEILN